MSDLFDQLLLSKQRFVICGDFNVPGADSSSLNPLMDNLISRYNLVQHVHQATHTAGNLLDLVITAESDSQLVSGTSVTQTPLPTDHYLVLCNLQRGAERSTVVSFSYRDIRTINLTRFALIWLRPNCSSVLTTWMQMHTLS